MDFATWWPAAAAALPGIGTLAYTFYKTRMESKEKQDERRQTFEEKQEAAFQRERELTSAERERQFEILRKDVDYHRNLANQKNQEKFAAFELAHFWHGKCWDMRNEAAQARQIAESASRLANKDLPVWGKPLDLPPFDFNANPSSVVRNT